VVAVIGEEALWVAFDPICDGEVDQLDAEVIGDVPEGVVVVPGQGRHHRPLGLAEAGAQCQVGQRVEDDGGVGVALQSLEYDLNAPTKVLRRSSLAKIVGAHRKGDQLRPIHDGVRHLVREDIRRRRQAGAPVREACQGILGVQTPEEPGDIVRARAAGSETIYRAVAEGHVDERRPAVARERSVDHVPKLRGANECSARAWLRAVEDSGLASRADQALAMVTVMANEGRWYRLRWVDVFTDRALAGNPLAVVLQADGLSTAQMQAIARETNLSETTFVLPPDKPEHAAKVRIFTPYAELPFAGHPTIGTSWVLLDEGLVSSDAAGFTLEEGVGPITVTVDRTGRSVLLWMTHPTVKFGETIEQRDELAAALGLTLADLQPEAPIQVASTGVPFAYVALKDAAAVDRAAANGEALSSVLEPHGLPPVFLFAAVASDRFYSRMFGLHSWARIVEDPATGSASGPAGAFAVRYGLVPPAPQVSIVSEQGTKMGRQSFIQIKLAYSTNGEIPERIEVGGSVVPVMTAELSVKS
jgi:trans-2,3-dihydro-3-hydroxyanthranilate isomerase